MSEEIVNDGEQPAEPEDERDTTIRYWSEIVQQALQHGIVIIEGFTCTKCNHRQFACHRNAEILPCMNCGNRIPSTAPQRQGPNEIQVAHYHLALNTIYTLAVQDQKTLPSLTATEMESLPGDIKNLMARAAQESRLDTLKTVASVVKKLADLD